jgi:uncharacterized membrane protein (DUF485 family)
VFAWVNGGIVVGDRHAHRPTLHLAQLPYFSLFAATAYAPIWLPSSMYVSNLCWMLATSVTRFLTTWLPCTPTVLYTFK